MNSVTQTRSPNRFHPDTLNLLRQAAIGAALFILAMTALAIKVPAQQTLFNVPTTDVLDKGKVYFELDVSAKPTDSDAVARFSSFVPRLLWGPEEKWNRA